MQSLRSGLETPHIYHTARRCRDVPIRGPRAMPGTASENISLLVT